MPEPLDLDRLDSLAAKATPGPWVADVNDVIWDAAGDRFIAAPARTTDAEFIAATDPQTVLALTAEIRRLAAKVAAVKALHAPEASIYGAVCSHCHWIPDSGPLYPCPTIKALEVEP